MLTSSAPETMVLTEQIYEGVVGVFREARGLCIEGDENIIDYVTEDDSDDDSNRQTVLSVQTLSRCRPFALPEEEISLHRRDWTCNR